MTEIFRVMKYNLNQSMMFRIWKRQKGSFKWKEKFWAKKWRKNEPPSFRKLVENSRMQKFDYIFKEFFIFFIFQPFLFCFAASFVKKFQVAIKNTFKKYLFKHYEFTNFVDCCCLEVLKEKTSSIKNFHLNRNYVIEKINVLDIKIS